MKNETRPGILVGAAPLGAEAETLLNILQNKDCVSAAADGGLSFFMEHGIAPDFWIGDGDSLGFIPKVAEKVVLPSVKDDTDTVAAVKYALAHGFKTIDLYGALGGERPSHSAANISLLAYIDSQGAKGRIIDRRCKVEYLTEKDGDVPVPSCRYFSLFAASGDAKVSISGAKYSGNFTLTPVFPLGVSNEPTEGASVKVLYGAAYLFLEGDCK